MIGIRFYQSPKTAWSVMIHPSKKVDSGIAVGWFRTIKPALFKLVLLEKGLDCLTIASVQIAKLSIDFTW